MPLTKKDEIELLTHIASVKDLEHDDNCGSCAKRKIEAEEASYQLEKDRPDFSSFSERVENRWKRTKYYEYYKELSDRGLTQGQIEDMFATRGWEL